MTTILTQGGSGRLHFIRNIDARASIAEYFSGLDVTSKLRDELPTNIFEKFRELAGSSPIFFTDRGGAITQMSRERLLQELKSDEDLEREARYLVARLEFVDFSIGNAIESNVKLTELLASYEY